MASELITVADLASYLQQGFPDGDTSAAGACAGAVAAVRTWTRRRITALDDDTTIVAGSSRIVLPNGPVRSVSSVLVDETETVTAWEIRPDDAIQWIGSPFTAPTSTETVTVEYDSGYADGDYRLEVARLVALRIASRIYQNPLDRNQFSGPENLSYNPALASVSRLLTLDEQMMLAPLRDMVGFA